jgi:hypothetical protein
MATYKVLQDIEAEDKFLGPLTLKQFIFGAIAIVGCWLSFVFITKGIWVVALPFFPVIIFTGFLAFPWGRDQPTETWMLAKIRFYFKPRKRIWDQTGIQELVKITAPKKVEQYLSDNLSQNEVKSRLKALAETIDSRGWAVKNIAVNMYNHPAYGNMSVTEGSDRLLDGTSLPQAVDTLNVGTIDDMFDEKNLSAVSSQIDQSNQQRKSNVIQTMKDIGQGSNTSDSQKSDFWFMNQQSNQPKGLTGFGTKMVTPITSEPLLPTAFDHTPPPMTAEEINALNEIKTKKTADHQSFRNHKTIDPNNGKNQHIVSTPPVTPRHDADTMRLAGNNDRTVESLARESNEIHKQSMDDEVIISLH